MGMRGNGMVRKDSLQLLTIIILSIAILGLSNLSGHPDRKSGGMGTTSEGLRAAFASYELSQGEKIHYEWESNSLVRFVITADPYHPQLAEFVNITGLSAEGSFVSPANAQYFLQATFLEASSGFEARIDYTTFRMTQFSESMIVAKPFVLTGLAIAVAGVLSWNWKERKASSDTSGERESLTFWHFFVADYKNWIAVVIGAVLLVVASALGWIDTSHLDDDYLIDWTNFLGRGFLFWGLVFGLWLSYNSYKVLKMVARNPS